MIQKPMDKVKNQFNKIIPQLWDKYKNNTREFGNKLRERMVRLGLSWRADRMWLDALLKKYTDSKWKLSIKDFSYANTGMDTINISAGLSEQGIDHVIINSKIYVKSIQSKKK